MKRFWKRSCRAGWVKPLAGLSRSIIRYHENLNYDYWSNGEAFVVESLSKFGLTNVVDIGAHFGTWTEMAVPYLKEARILCVEPIAHSCELIRKKEIPNVKIVHSAVGAQKGEIELFYSDNAEVLASVYQIPKKTAQAEKSEKVPLTTGDELLRAAGIERAEFVKVDVEGHEFDVVEGFRNALENKRVTAMQFEYGFANIISKRLLRDFYELFSGYGYVVGKIYPKNVDFSEYEYSKEDFLGPNYLAVDKSRKEIIQALSL